MTFDIERFMEVAKELGFEVILNSDTPGFLNSTTGEHKTYDEISEELFEKLGVTKEE